MKADEVIKTPGTVLFLSHDSSRSGAPIFLLRFLRWLRQNSKIQFRVLVGKSGELTADFEEIGAVDSFEPDRALWYRVLRRLGLHRQFVCNHRAKLRNILLK